ncbi:MAG: acylphosphatase [Candidatus Petromonas sp.]|nr:acylphosphatase [Candidatus Petromonas sp.]
MVRYHIIVHGHVQGVGFRYFTYQKAMENNIKGWVKNNLDGTVEIDAQGNKDDMEKFLTAVKKGSPFSKVRNVDVDEFQHLERYKSFDIRY